MTKFAKTLTALAAMATLTVFAAPMADAAPMKPVFKPAPVAMHTDPGAARKIDARIAGLRSDIRTGQRMHKLNAREVTSLTNKLDAIAGQKRADDRHGLSGREAASLNASLDNLSSQLRMASRH